MKLFSKADKAKVNEKFESFKNSNISSEDTEDVVNNIDDILNKSSNGPLAKFFADIKTMCAMVKAWARKEYREVPIKTIVMVTLTLGYVYFPPDFIPDYIPGLGLVDDATMVALCLAAVKSDIEDFKIWAKAHV